MQEKSREKNEDDAEEEEKKKSIKTPTNIKMYSWHFF